ncbi:MAG: efflux RND transporter permease subunit, partial [Clostridiales bacterium]|nr:efflux RND transporter permease subunit [Clostridiales bacterium]
MKNKNFVSGLLERKLLVIIVVIMLFIAGGFCYYKMPKQHFPKVVLPVASVTAIYPGATAEDMEQLVSEKVEHVCMELDGFDKCETTAADNYSVTTVTLGMDLSQEEVDDRFDELKEKMSELQSDLPSGVTSISVNDEIMDTAGIILAVSGDSISTDELSQRSKELADKLRLIDGIRKVDIEGDVPSEVKITVNTDKLNDTNVSLAELAEIISYHNSTLPTGSIEVDGSDIKVTASGRFESLDDIKNIVVSANEDYIITRLSDIADIRMEVPDDEGYYLYNDSRSTVLAVYFQEGLNVVSMGDEINDVIDSYNASLPEGISVNKIFMQPDQVSDSINSFLVNLAESIILVIIVIMVGMNFRNAIVVSVAIPLSIFISFICIYFMGYEIQFVSLASLIVVLGMLVDNGVVVSDAIQKNLGSGMNRRDAVVQGTSSMILPVFLSMLTTVLAFSAILTLPGAYKQLAQTFPIVIICCLVASFLVSVCVTPVMSWFFLKKTKENKSDKIPFSVRVYDRLFSYAFRHKRLTILGAVCIMLLMGTSLLTLKLQIIPKANDNIVLISVDTYAENNIERTREITDKIEEILDLQPETDYYLTGVGLSIPRYDVSILPKGSGDSVGDIFVRLDLSESDRFDKAADMVDFLQNEFDENIGGADIVTDELGIMKLNTNSVEMKIYSDSIEDLNTAAELLNNMMSRIKGTKGIKNSSELAAYNYSVDLNKMKLNTLGLMEAEVQNELSIALLGRDVSAYRSGSKEYTVVLDSDINSREQIKAFKVKSSAMNEKYSVSQFADVGLTSEISSITRIDGRRGRTVYADVSSETSDIEAQIQLEKMIEENSDIFPESVTIEKSGIKKIFFEEVLLNIGIAAGAAFIAILLILAVRFGSFKKVAILFVSVPFGVCTGFFALLITGQPLSFFALIGCVSLLGCVLANAIVLMECITEEREKGLEIEAACKAAGGRRLRPIMMSTMTTVLGLLPLALFGDELFVPMAVLMLAGLFAAMIVNLVLVPLIYYIV